MGSKESISNNQEELSEKERREVDDLKQQYRKLKQERPDVSADDFHQAIVSRLGYYLGVPGYGLMDGKKGVQPSEEGQARLEQLYQMVIAEDPKSEWDDMATPPDDMREEHRFPEGIGRPGVDKAAEAAQEEANRRTAAANREVEMNEDLDPSELDLDDLGLR